jgi:hypothetical protein
MKMVGAVEENHLPTNAHHSYFVVGATKHSMWIQEIKLATGHGSALMASLSVLIHMATQWSQPMDIEQIPPLELFIDPGTASVEQLTELFDAINNMYKSAGGYGLLFEVGETHGRLTKVLARPIFTNKGANR